MSLNNISLHIGQIAELYPATLVESTIVVPDSSGLRFLGSNARNIVVLTDYPDVSFLPDSDLSFLTSVLGACKLSIGDTAIVNKSKVNMDITQVLKELQARQVLLFGIEPLDIGLPMNFPVFQLQAFDKRTYLYSPTLGELQKDKANKMQLWNCLKKMFGLIN